MPIANRSVQPVLVSQIKVPTTVENEFEYVVNATLSNLIKQMASLSLKANDIFGELATSFAKFGHRIEALNAKIQNINSKIPSQEPTLSPLINPQLSVYKSHIDRDDELLDHTQMPICIREMFNEAQKPPELFKLDAFRKNDDESMRFYTDPDFFLREWLSNARNERKKKKEKKKKRKSTKERQSMQEQYFPPPISINSMVQEPIFDNNPTDYNYGDVAVYEDPSILKPPDYGNNEENLSYNINDLPPVNFPPLPPPPPIFSNFPICLPPAPPPAPVLVKVTKPSVQNLMADIQKGSVLRPVAAREDVREKTKDFCDLIKELRPAWDNQSDDSDESDD